MTVTVGENGAIRLAGICPIEDAEALLAALSGAPDAVVDWTTCEQAHTAVIQVLLAAAPQMIGPPRDPFLANHVSTLIANRPASHS